MWNLATQSALVAIVISGATTVALLLKSRKLIHVYFAGFALSIGGYYLTALISDILPDQPLLKSLNIVAGGLVVIFAATFFEILVGNASGKFNKSLRKTYSFALLIICIGLTPLSQNDFIQMGLLIGAVAVLSVRTPQLFLSARKIKSGVDKKRLQYMSIAGGITMVAFCLDFAAHLGWPFPAVGGLFVAVYLYFMSQALWASRLLDLHELLGKALVFGCLTFILAFVYGFLVIWVGSSPGLFWFNTLLASGLILILFEPLKTQLEERTAKQFFEYHVNFTRELRNSLKNLSTIVEVKAACDFVLDQIYENKRATHVSLYTLNPERMGFILQSYRGPKPAAYLDGRRYPVLFRCIIEKQNPLLKETLEQRLFESENHRRSSRFSTSKTDEYSYVEDSSILQTLKSLQSELMMPLSHMGRVIGILNLKDARFSKAFTKDEISALRQLCEQLAVTIENSRVFEQIKEKDHLAVLGEMSAGLAHEIRNPLTAIKGAVQTLDLQHIGKEDRDLLKIVVDEVNRLNKVVAEFLDYAKPLKSTAEYFSVNDIICKTLRLLEHDQSKKVQLSLKLTSESPKFFGDAEQFRQVLINLIGNAKEASKEGQKVKIVSSLVGEKEKFIEIRIIDEGIGLPEVSKERLFIPFYTTKRKGTGLGLSVCQRIAREHGGRIFAVPNRKKGATFIVKLPFEQNIHELKISKKRKCDAVKNSFTKEDTDLSIKEIFYA